MIDRKKLVIVCKCSNVIQIYKVLTDMSEKVKCTLHDTMPIETGVVCIGGKVETVYAHIPYLSITRHSKIELHIAT